MIHYGKLQRNPNPDFINFGYCYLIGPEAYQNKQLILASRSWVLGLENYNVFREGKRIIDEGEPVRMSFFS